MLKKKYVNSFFLCLCVVSAIAGHAETAYYSVSIQADIVTVSTTVLYAYDIPYVSLGELLSDLGGVLRVTPDQIQANYSGITAVFKLNDVAVSVPGLAFTLIYPARVHEGDIYLSQADIADFFARAYHTRIMQTEPAAAAQQLAPVTPDEPLLDEDTGLLLEALSIPPPEIKTEAAITNDTPAETDTTATPEEQTVADSEPEQEALALADLAGIIVLDAGHGGQDSGASVRDGIVEKEFTLEIAMNVRRLLKETTGLTILMTRDGDKDIPSGVRAKIADSSEGDLLISIHTGYSATTRANGVTIFTDQSPSVMEEAMTAEMRHAFAVRRTCGERAATIAYYLAQTLAADGTLGPVTVRTTPLIAQRMTELPCILIELIYLSNPETAAATTEEAYRERVAQSLAGAIAISLAQHSN